MAVKSFPVSILIAEECAEAGVRINTTLSPYAATDTNLGRLLVAMSTIVNDLHRALTLSRKKPLTQEILEKDAARGRIYGNLVKFIRGEQSHHLPEKAQAASLLYGILKQHGLGIHHGSYAVESTRLRGLFVDFDLSPQKEAAVTLGIEEAILELKQAEEEFSVVHNQLIDAKAGIEDIPTISEIADPLRVYLRTILNYLSGLELADPATWAGVVNEINEITIELTAQARSRKTRRKNDEEEEPPPVEEPPVENPQ